MTETPKPLPWANRCVNCGTPLLNCLATSRAASDPNEGRCCPQHLHHDADLTGAERRRLRHRDYLSERRAAEAEARADAERAARPSPLMLATRVHRQPVQRPRAVVVFSSTTPTTKES